jgi:hypothetical protein
MALSIRNSAVEALARELARCTGKNITDTIAEVLADRLDQLSNRSGKVRDELLSIARECAQEPDIDARTPGEILGYNGIGMFNHGN